MNVVIYARYSSHNQHETSIEGQLKVCYEYCKQHGYVVVGEYIDRAISGTHDKRPQFLKMIDDAAKKQFKYVLVYQLDRFSRNRYDSATYKNKLKKYDVRVLSARENISDDASGILMESILEGMAEYYSAELAQKIRRGMDLNGERCLSTGGNTALGYTVDSEKKFQINPVTAPIVKTIFEMYVGGSTMTEIANHLNSQGFQSSRGRAFNVSSVGRILQNKRYIGIYTYKGKEVPDGIPRIVSDELFYTAEKMLDKRRKAPATSKAREEYLLTTKMFCGYCKAMMRGYGGTSKTGKAHHYYACKNRIKKICHKKNVHKQEFEDFIVAQCLELLTPENIALIAREVVKACDTSRDTSYINSLESQIRDIERKQSNLMDAVIDCDVDSVRKSLYAKMPELERRKSALEEELALEKTKQVYLTERDVRFFLTGLKIGNMDDMKYRKTLITIFVNKIYLYDDKMTIIFNSGSGEVLVDVDMLDVIDEKNAETESSFLSSQAPPYENAYFLSLRKGRNYGISRNYDLFS